MLLFMKTCNIPGTNKNHNCKKCNDDYPINIENENYLNCYENCSYYHYFDNENNYRCTNSCPKEYPKLNIVTKECIKNDIKYIIEELIINERTRNRIL